MMEYLTQDNTLIGFGVLSVMAALVVLDFFARWTQRLDNTPMPQGWRRKEPSYPLWKVVVTWLLTYAAFFVIPAGVMWVIGFELPAQMLAGGIALLVPTAIAFFGACNKRHEARDLAKGIVWQPNGRRVREATFVDVPGRVWGHREEGG